jgi:imidazolonepropionase-like amidohydrolase
MAARGAYAIPTLVTYDALAEHGAALGFPAESVAKIENVRGAGLQSLEIFKRAGTAMAFGTDLLGDLHVHQSDEFRIRSRVLPTIDVLRQATSVAAEVLRMPGRLGAIKVGAIADILVVDGDPLTDIERLCHQGRHLDVIMKAGVLFKNRLS